MKMPIEIELQVIREEWDKTLALAWKLERAQARLASMAWRLAMGSGVAFGIALGVLGWMVSR